MLQIFEHSGLAGQILYLKKRSFARTDHKKYKIKSF